MYRGISRNGATNLLVFECKLDGPGFETMMVEFLLPLIAGKMPNFHKFHIDNAPKHTAAESIRFLGNKP